MTAPAAWRRGAVALATVAAGVSVLVLAILPGPALAGGAPMGLQRLLTLSGGVALLVVAWGLWRGKRRAFGLLAAALLGALALRSADGAGLVELGVGLGLAALLLTNRRAFPCGGAARAGHAAGAVLMASAGAAFALATALLSRGPTEMATALAHALGWLLAGNWWLRSDSLPLIALDVLIVLAVAAGALLLRSLMRPAVAAEGHTPAEHARAAALVAEHGYDSLAPFALREDKAFHFAHGGMLAYRTLNETAVVSGDPIGPPGAGPAILASFERFAAEQGWEVVLTAASERDLAGFRALGHRVIRIGSEAVVDPGGFSLEGRAIRKVRQSVARLERLGWAVELVEAADLTAEQAAGVGAVEDAWRAAQPRLYGFAMTLGRLWGAEEDGHGLYVLGRDESGTLRSFLRFARYRQGLSLDVMRRSGETPNGLNESLVVAALGYAREREMSEVSLNFAGFAHVMAAEAALGRRQRLLRWVLTRMHGRFQLERLVRFNDKFNPVWRPRHLVYRGGPGLPLGALRVLQAEAYVRPPRSRPLTARWTPVRQPALADSVERRSAASGLERSPEVAA